MWMDLRIYSLKANSQAGNKWVYVMTTQKGHLRILPENLTEGFGSKGEGWWNYIFENKPKKLILKSIFPKKVAAILLSGSRKGTVGA